MQQHKQARHMVSAGAAAVALSALAALLAALALAGTGSTVYAAPRSGGPTLDVTSITGNTITVTGAGWTSNEAITLSYSASSSCLPSTALPASSYTLSWEGSDFQLTLTWPSTIGQGDYYLCASGSNSGGPIPTQQTIIVNNNGSVQPTPGSTTPPNATATGNTPATTTSTPGHNPGSTATNSGTTGNGTSGGDSNAGNKGASASSSVSSLVAIILLCLLVLALLVYLIRIWLQGRQASGPTPPTP